MKQIRINKSQARRFLIRYHGLSGGFGAGKAGVMAVFDCLRCVQYDPLDVVTRNADLVLQARVKNYRPAQLGALLYGEHRLTDGWDKMMSLFPSEDFYRFGPLHADMERYARAVLKWRNQEAALDNLDAVRAHIRAHGESAAADIPLGSLAQGRWGRTTVAGAALEYLFYRGELCVSSRKGTVKRYDFPERVLPAEAAAAKADDPDLDAFMDWYVLRRIGSAGLVWNKNGGSWLGQLIEQKPLRTAALERLIRSERVARVEVEGLKESLYCQSDYLPLFHGGPLKNTVRFLAPLDNMLWDRALVKALFDFSYTWEVYVPASKRRYGYYVLPVLCGERFLGRFEPEPYRPGGTFTIKQLWTEPDFNWTDAKRAAFDAATESFARYLASSRTEETRSR